MSTLPPPNTHPKQRLLARKICENNWEHVFVLVVRCHINIAGVQNTISCFPLIILYLGGFSVIWQEKKGFLEFEGKRFKNELGER